MSDLAALALVTALLWGGVFLYFLRLDARVRKLEKE